MRPHSLRWSSVVLTILVTFVLCVSLPVVRGEAGLPVPAPEPEPETEAEAEAAPEAEAEEDAPELPDPGSDPPKKKDPPQEEDEPGGSSVSPSSSV